MVTICVAGQSSVSIGVLIDALSVQGDVRVVGLPNPSDVPGSRTRWQPSLREKLKEYSIPEVSLKWCENNPDIILVSCEYERLLNVDRFSTARLYNVHFSLLPAHKGAYPTTFAVLRGDSQVGPTLHWIDAGIDTGPIVAQSPTSIGPDMTALDVYMVCQINGRKLVRRNWEGLLSGRACSRPQPSEGSTFESRAGLDFAALSQVNAKASAEQVKRQIAAANFRPYQLPTFNGFTISGAQILETESRQRYGTVLHQEKSLIRVATIDFDIELMIDQYPRFWDACRQGHFQDARSMLPSLHRIDEYDEFGRRALYYAIKSESIRTVRVLLESGATASDLDGFGTSAYSLATAMSSTETRNSMLKLIEELTNVLPNRRPDSDSPSSHQASE